MKTKICTTLLLFGLLGLLNIQASNQSPFHGLKFKSLPTVWDEAIPLGNGIIGNLIWEKDGHLRLALDRADLWDLRPVKEFELPSYSYQFVYDEIVNKKDVTKVRELIDDRSRKDCAPTKIPVGAIEFPISDLGKVKSVELDAHTAVCTVIWECGAIGKFFTDAVDKVGHFRFENLPTAISVELQTPRFEDNGTEVQRVTAPRTHLLTRLGYKNGKITHRNNHITYRQKVYGKVSYEVALQWNNTKPGTLEGKYYVTTQGTWYSESIQATDFLETYPKDFDKALAGHLNWWKGYWNKSSISLPDQILENQWYMEMYKFGSASRKNAPPICLQAVWTADNGQTPPWRRFS